MIHRPLILAMLCIIVPIYCFKAPLSKPHVEGEVISTDSHLRYLFIDENIHTGSNQPESVCDYGPQSDQLKLTFNFNDRSRVRVIIDAQTRCSPVILNTLKRLQIANQFDYIECKDQLMQQCNQAKFTQQYGIREISGNPTFVIAKVTISNPAIFDSNQYNCQIKGDGQEHYFGPTIYEQTPEINLDCIRIQSHQNLSVDGSVIDIQ